MKTTLRLLFAVAATIALVACGRGVGNEAHRAVFVAYLVALESRDYPALREAVHPEDIARWEARAPGLLRRVVDSGELIAPLDFSKIQKRKIRIEEFVEDEPGHFRLIFLIPNRDGKEMRYHASVVERDGRSYFRLPLPE